MEPCLLCKSLLFKLRHSLEKIPGKLTVKMGCGLISDNDGWAVDQGPGYGNSLQFTPGNAAGREILAVFDPKPFKQRFSHGSSFCRGDPQGQ